MAELEQVGLLIDGDTLYGVAARSGVPSKVQSWRFSSVAAATEEVGSQKSEVESQKSEVGSPEPPNVPAAAPPEDAAGELTGGSTVQRTLADALASAREALPPNSISAASAALIQDFHLFISAYAPS